jgi:hypothetical protein
LGRRTASSRQLAHCEHCGKLIGIYEPLIALEHGTVRETSWAADPGLPVAHASYYHHACYTALRTQRLPGAAGAGRIRMFFKVLAHGGAPAIAHYRSSREIARQLGGDPEDARRIVTEIAACRAEFIVTDDWG